MRAAILSCVVLTAGCSKKSETKNEPAPAKQAPAAEAPASGQPPETKPPEAKPIEHKPAVDAPKLDCNTILTAEDIQKACGAKVEVHAGKQEGSGPLFTCQRTISEVGKRFPIAYWFVRVGKTPADVAGIAKLEKLPEAKPIAGLGDEAWSSEHEETKLKITDYDVNVRKGLFLFKVSAHKDSLNKKPPCTLDQMAELAKVATNRLP
jgi:hypothetical protein